MRERTRKPDVNTTAVMIRLDSAVLRRSERRATSDDGYGANDAASGAADASGVFLGGSAICFSG